LTGFRPTGMRSLVAAVALVVLTTGGCARGGQPPSGGPQVDRIVPITVERTGGIAGVQDEVTVQPDGSWGRTGKASPSRGRMPADRNDTLTRMAADPALQAEAARSSPESACADAFEYTVSVGAVRVAWTDCGATPPPVASRIAQFLLDGTNSR
jgi:hypothetical protein